ncbi:MAG: SelT/SelW/SelH family protein [Chloroflexi bacterium]|nr:MAG: SelT/SelW/SelH family protein [Chloroflexota bacterium]
MTAEVLGDRSIAIFVRSWQLIPSSGGRFEVTVNGDLVFSKKQLGRHAEPGEVYQIIRQKLESILPPGVTIPEPEEDDDD